LPLFTHEEQFPVKGSSLNAEQLLGSADLACPFIDGPLLVARLSPMDYHHVHYPDAGQTLEHHKKEHRLWTVNWKAMQNKSYLYIENEHEIQILDTENFGHLAIVEVGALTVGRIAQVHPVEQPFKRGEQKSVFHFGGSAVVLFGEPRAWRPSNDLLEYTQQGVETLVRLGELVAMRY
jgi:phosphatidylserine decarboxylase